MVFKEIGDALVRISRLGIGAVRLVSDGSRLLLLAESRVFRVRAAIPGDYGAFDVVVSVGEFRRATKKMSGECRLVMCRGFFEVSDGRRYRVVLCEPAGGDSSFIDCSAGAACCGSGGSLFGQLQSYLKEYNMRGGELLSLRFSSDSHRSIVASSPHCARRIVVERVYGNFSADVSPYLFFKALAASYIGGWSLIMGVGGGAFCITRKFGNFEFSIQFMESVGGVG